MAFRLSAAGESVGHASDSLRYALKRFDRLCHGLDRVLELFDGVQPLHEAGKRSPQYSQRLGQVLSCGSEVLPASNELLRVAVEDVAGATQVTSPGLDRLSRRVQVAGGRQKILAPCTERNRAGIDALYGASERVDAIEYCVNSLLGRFDDAGLVPSTIGHGVQILGCANDQLTGAHRGEYHSQGAH